MPRNRFICPRTGKRGYDSKRTAKAATKTVNNRFRVFYCKHCRHWHTTSELESFHKVERLRERDRKPRLDY